MEQTLSFYLAQRAAWREAAVFVFGVSLDHESGQTILLCDTVYWKGRRISDG